MIRVSFDQNTHDHCIDCVHFTTLCSKANINTRPKIQRLDVMSRGRCQRRGISRSNSLCSDSMLPNIGINTDYGSNRIDGESKNKGEGKQSMGLTAKETAG